MPSDKFDQRGQKQPRLRLPHRATTVTIKPRIISTFAMSFFSFYSRTKVWQPRCFWHRTAWNRGYQENENDEVGPDLENAASPLLNSTLDIDGLLNETGKKLHHVVNYRRVAIVLALVHF